MLEFNSLVADFFTSFWNIPHISLVADVPIFFLPLFLWWAWLYYTFSKNINDDARRELSYIFYACVLWMLLSFIIKQFVDIDRPDSYIESTKNMILGTIPEKSFPSDHATISFAFTTALLYTRYYKIAYVFFPLVILMNLSRIVIGVHWPLDIFAGSVLGIISAIVFFHHLAKLKFVKTLDLLIIKVMKTLHLY